MKDHIMFNYFKNSYLKFLSKVHSLNIVNNNKNIKLENLNFKKIGEIWVPKLFLFSYFNNWMCLKQTRNISFRYWYHN